MKGDVIRIATRGSALALAQAHGVRDRCRALLPEVGVAIEIIKTTGDRLGTASFKRTESTLPKGLFTKELEIALLEERADLAVHSLKDLPTDLPDGLCLGAVPERADARDMLIVRTTHNRDAAPARGIPGIGLIPEGGVLATSSARRRAQWLDARPDLRVVEIRGNVETRLGKLARDLDLDGTILAAAGLARLGIRLEGGGRLVGLNVPDGLTAVMLEPETMLPCVGQGALGIERRVGDDRMAAVCAGLDHGPSHRCVEAERSFLAGMGGGCQSPIAAYAEARDDQIRLRGASFVERKVMRGEIDGGLGDAADLGAELARRLRGGTDR
jgi:hydroxymethylbilane synthase